MIEEDGEINRISRLPGAIYISLSVPSPLFLSGEEARYGEGMGGLKGSTSITTFVANNTLNGSMKERVRLVIRLLLSSDQVKRKGLNLNLGFAGGSSPLSF
jgi:hypothetical protein